MVQATDAFLRADSFCKGRAAPASGAVVPPAWPGSFRASAFAKAFREVPSLFRVRQTGKHGSQFDPFLGVTMCRLRLRINRGHNSARPRIRLRT